MKHLETPQCIKDWGKKWLEHEFSRESIFSRNKKKRLMKRKKKKETK